MNVNSVPDRAEIGIDLRTLPGMRHNRLRDQIASYLGDAVEVMPRVDLESVWTDPTHPWMRQVFHICASITGETPKPEAAPYSPTLAC